MGRPQQNLPRAFRQPQRAQAAKHASSGATWAWIGIGVLLLAAAILGTLAVINHTSSQAVAEDRLDRGIGAVLAGIPQRGRTLGAPTAPVTLEIFLDLKDPDSRSWMANNLPAIIRDHVRTGALKLEYRAYKTNTFSPQEFVKDQTAALAAGAQNKLWNFIYIFYSEQGSEFTPYATEAFLEHVARRVPGLDLARWHADRHTGRREEQVTSDDHTARTFGLYVTPSFRIGKTGGTMRNFSGHAIIKYKEQHPIGLPTSGDVGKAIREVESARGS